MLPRLLPPGVAEGLLLLFVLGLLFVVGRAVAKRRQFTPLTPNEDVELPDVETQQRIRATVRRVHRDPAQGVWLVDVALGKRRLTFCAEDYAEKTERYTGLVGKEADIAPYALATLALGGADTIRDQIKNADKVEIRPDLVRLVPAPNLGANDYFVIGRILSHREDTMDDLPLILYRCEVIRDKDLNMVLELAVPADPPLPIFPDQSMVHGTARLYGYLPTV